MTTKAPPAVNLKERIAALQQRNVTPPSQRTSSTSPTVTPSASPSSVNALRDKIAKFEKRGGVPIPRGSFGLGAPPPTENGSQKRRGELYGNRIPSQVTGGSFGVSTHQTGGAFPPSAMNMGNNGLNSRRFSMSQVEMEGSFDQLPQSSASPTPPAKEPETDEPSSNHLSPNRPSLSAERERIQRSVSSSGILERSAASDTPTISIMTDTPMVQEPVEQVPDVVISNVGLSANTAEMPVEACSAPVISNDATIATLLPEPEQSSSPSAPPPVLVHEPTPIISATPPTTLPPSTVSPLTKTEAQPLSTVKPEEPKTIPSPTANPVEPITRTQTKEEKPISPSWSQPLPPISSVPGPDYDPFSYVENNPTKSTFSATVHRKTVESPPRAQAATTTRATIVVTPQPDLGKVAVVGQTPTSPGFGELSMLVNQAVTLEAMLDGTPAPEPASSTPPADAEKLTTEAKKRVESKSSKSSLRRKRSMGGNSLKKSKTAPAAVVAQVEPPVPAVPIIPISTEPFVPPPLDPRPKRSIARDLVLDGESSTPLSPPSSYVSPDSRKSTTAREANKSTESIPSTPSPKSPGKPRYFASLRRLGNSSSHPPSSATSATGILRGSQSFTTHLVTKDDSISSAEDSPTIVTPIDHVDSGSMLGQPRESRDGRPGSIYNVNWPGGKSVSSSIMRASSFAEKMWHRTRTRSTTSTTGGKLTSPSAHSLIEPTLLPAVQTFEPMSIDENVTKPIAPVLPPPRTSSLSPPTQAPPPSLLTPLPQLPPLSSGLLDQTFESSPLLDMSMFDSLSSSPQGLHRS